MVRLRRADIPGGSYGWEADETETELTAVFPEPIVVDEASSISAITGQLRRVR